MIIFDSDRFIGVIFLYIEIFGNFSKGFIYQLLFLHVS